MSSVLPVPKVSVAMLAYNHGKFIAQAIESVLMQKTDFPLELVIGEDDSSDNTGEICLSYAQRHPGRIRLFLRKRNDPKRLAYPSNLAFNVAETLDACRGEYIAFLDGDDFWTDERKLKIQVDVLENNPGTVICSHRYRRLIETTGEQTNDFFDADFEGFDQKVINYQNFLNPPLLLWSFMLFRREALDGFREKQSKWDTSIWAHLLSHGGNGIILNRFMGVYRKHAGGAWSSLQKREQLKCSFEQHCHMVENEGFASACIKSSFLGINDLRADDLITHTKASLAEWETYAKSVMGLFAKQQNSILLRSSGWIQTIIHRLQERLLSTQTEHLKLITTTSRSRGGRLVRFLVLIVWLAAALPLIILVSIHRTVVQLGSRSN